MQKILIATLMLVAAVPSFAQLTYSPPSNAVYGKNASGLWYPLNVDTSGSIILSGGGGTGTVTSVGAPPFYTVSNASTTPTFTLLNKAANAILAGPVSGGVAAPTYRALVTADIPQLAYSSLSGLPTLGTAAAQNTTAFDAAGAAAATANLVNINSICSFSPSNTGATNSSCFATALATGSGIYIPCAGTPASPMPYPLGSTAVIGAGHKVVGQNSQCVVLQPPTNTVGVNIYGEGPILEDVTIQYASQESAANTSSIGLEVGNVSATQFFYYGKIANVFIKNANTAFGSASSLYGEFQNHLENLNILYFSKYAIYEAAPNSGSVFTNARIQNSGPQPASSDCNTAISFANGNNIVFDVLNTEYMNCSTAIIQANQTGMTINSWHIEQASVTNDYGGAFNVDYQSQVLVNNLVLIGDKFNIPHGGLFNFYAGGASSGSNTLTINGITEYSNTFTSNLPLFFDDGNYNKAYVTGFNGRNTHGLVVTSRNNLVQVEGYRTVVPGGSFIAGIAGTTSPTGTLPYPFSGVNYMVGDLAVNTAVTATTSPGWICTTSSATPTFTPEPAL